VFLQIEQLDGCLNEDEVNNTISNVPDSMEKLYAQRLEKIASIKQVSRLRHIFLWIAVAPRQLTMLELANAPGVGLASPDDILVICPPGMLAKRPNPTRMAHNAASAKTSEGNQGAGAVSVHASEEVVVFDHPSIKRFLSSPRIRSFGATASTFYLETATAESQAAELTLQYLVTTLAGLPQSSKEISSHPFTLFAANDGILLVRASIGANGANPNLKALLFEFFGSPLHPAFLNWIRMTCIPDVRMKSDNTEGPSPPYVGIALRMPILVDHPIVPDTTMKSDQTGVFPSPLYVAIVLRMPIVVGHLIAQGLFINDIYHGSEHRTALHLAISCRQYQLAIQLLAANADAKQLNSYKVSPLYRAVDAGELELVRTLLHAGADASHVGGTYGNALQAACYSGHLEIVQALLTYQPKVNVEGGIFGTALQAAAAAGHHEIVLSLLQAKASIDTDCGLLGNPLQAALTGNHQPIIETFVFSGATIDRKGDHFWSEALHRLEAIMTDLTDPKSLLGDSALWRPADMSRPQDLLAISRAVLLSLPRKAARTTSSSSRLSKHLPRRLQERDIQARCAETALKIYRCGLSGTNNIGFAAKALFYALCGKFLLDIDHFEKTAQFERPMLCDIIDLITARESEQTLLEKTSLTCYADARSALVDLYTAAFKLIASMAAQFAKRNFKKWIVSFEATSTARQIEEAFQALLSLDKKFGEAMLVARTSAVMAQTDNLKTQLTQIVKDDIEQSTRERDQRLQVAMVEMESRILNSLRDSLPSLIRDEVRKALVEQGHRGG
jgi:hypothetical protein